MSTINPTIRLDGEAQFKRQLTEAKNAVSALNAEMDLAESQFRETGNAQELMRTRSQALNEKLTAQKRAVDAAKAALAQCKSQGLDPNSREVMTWRQRLAQAERQVIETTREIDNNKRGLDLAGRSYTATGRQAEQLGNKLEDAGGKASGMTEALRGIGNGVAWQNVSEGISNISQAIDRGIHKAVQFGRSLWNMTADATTWADDLQTLSTQTGIDTRTLQQWEYAARFIDTDVDTIVAARNRITRGMGGDLGAQIEELGVSTTDAAGSLRDGYDVMWDTLAVLGAMEDSTERDALAMELFGRSASELLPLIRAGREEWDSYANRAPVVSDENIERLGAANDALENLDATFQVTRQNMLASLAPALEAGAGALSDAMEQLNAYLATEEGQERMEQFSQAVVNLATNLLDIDWGQAIQTASDALVAITDALNWIAEHKEVVIAALAAIAGARIWSLISSAGSNIGRVVNGFQQLLGTGGTGGAGPVVGTGGPAVTGGGGLLTGGGAAAGGTGAAAAGGTGAAAGTGSTAAAATEAAAAATEAAAAATTAASSVMSAFEWAEASWALAQGEAAGLSSISGTGAASLTGIPHLLAAGGGTLLGMAMLSGMAYLYGTTNEYLDIDAAAGTGMNGRRRISEEEQERLEAWAGMTDSQRRAAEATADAMEARYRLVSPEDALWLSWMFNYATGEGAGPQAYAERAAWAMQHGASARSQFAYLATNAGGAASFMDMWTYSDANGRERNYLQDLLTGIDYQSGDNQLLLAEIYRGWSHVFGDITTARGLAALRELPEDMQRALEQGAASYQYFLNTGTPLSDADLAVYMDAFFRASGLYNAEGVAQITTDAPGDQRSRREREAQENGATTGITFVPDPRVSGGYTGITEQVGMSHAELSRFYGFDAGWVPSSQTAETQQSLADMAETVTEYFTLTRDGSAASIYGAVPQDSELAQLVASAISQTRIEMDAHSVGRAVAPTVQEILARDQVSRAY